MILRALVIATLLANAGQIRAQSPAFEVATIKPSAPDARGGTIYNPSGGRFAVANMTLKDLITIAYDVRGFQISGGPGCIDSSHYDVVAKPESPGDLDYLKPMLQTHRRSGNEGHGRPGRNAQAGMDRRVTQMASFFRMQIEPHPEQGSRLTEAFFLNESGNLHGNSLVGIVSSGRNGSAARSKIGNLSHFGLVISSCGIVMKTGQNFTNRVRAATVAAI